MAEHKKLLNESFINDVAVDKNNDEKTMTEIEEILDMTGFDFDIYGKRGWIAQVEDEEEDED